VAAASLPSTVFGAGEKTLFRWTVTADSKGAIGWKKVVFDVSGAVHIGATDTFTIGSGPTTTTSLGRDGDGTSTDGIYMGTSTTAAGAVAKQLIATSSMKIYNVATGDEVTATTTDTGWYVWNYLAGGARVAFVAAAEQVIAAGETKTYEFRGNVSYGGASGDSISTKIEKRSTATSTSAYATIVGNGWTFGRQFSAVTSTAPTFVWTDRSGLGATHTSVTNDWTMGYKVSGLPTATLSLSK